MDKRVVEIGSPEFWALRPEDFDPAVIQKIWYLLLGPGYRPTQAKDSTTAWETA